MSKEGDNKAVIARWFTEFWGKDVNLAVVDEIAAADMLLKYSLQEPRRGRNDIKAFMTDFRGNIPRSQFLGHGGSDRRGRVRRRSVGRWRHPYGSHVQRLSDRRSPGCNRP
jgi:SnoaL-like polyketide cyclase